jgi:hypothetical protein
MQENGDGGDPSKRAPSVYAEFVAGELEREFERRRTLDQRGISVVTSSSTLVTLLAALAAFMAARPTGTSTATTAAATLGTARPTGTSVATFGLALMSFVVAALLGLLANRSRAYQVLDEESMLSLRQEDAWNLSADEARWLIVGRQVDTLTSLRAGNFLKSRLVNRALMAQIAALALLAIAIITHVVALTWR